MLEIGSYLNNKYKILSVIGSGGMSVVYLALNERVNKTWAIKEVRKDGGNDAQVKRQNLVAEVDILKDLKHPHLPSIVDIVDTEDSFIMVMDYVEGESLEKIMKRTYDEKNFCSTPLSKENVLEWAKQLCDVLGYLHNREHPIIYRDMKPGNIMLRPDNSVALIDFGTAREYKESSIEDTTCLGSRGYAAPEQYGFSASKPTADIYAVGVLMNEMLTGALPNQKRYRGLLEYTVQNCLEMDPANRYQSVDELSKVLEHYRPKTAKEIAGQVQSWLPPGFRTKNIPAMIVASMWYALILWIGLELQVENWSGGPLILARILVLAVFFGGTLWFGNYRNAWKRMPMSSSPNFLIRCFGILTWGAVLTTTTYILGVLCIMGMYPELG